MNEKTTDMKNKDSIPTGLVSSKVYGSYYDVSSTITTAGTSNPNDPDSNTYNRERIFEALERNAETLLVKNDGRDTLFVIVTHIGSSSFSKEVPIYQGELKVYYNVYELRLRSPTAGNAYRVMEYDLCCNPGTAKVINKTQNTSLIALQQVTVAPRVVISSDLSVTTAMGAAIFIRMGRQTETAFTASINIRIEATPQTSGTIHWHTLTSFASALGSSVASQAVNGACAAGQAVVPMTDTTGFSVGDIVFINNTTLANSEFGKVATVSANVSITLEENLTNAQTGSTVYDQAEIYPPVEVDCTAIGRIRIVVDGAGAAQNFVIEAIAVTGDSISS